MPRSARIVIPGLPHHITQRGNRKQAVFFRDVDQEVYLSLFAAKCVQFAVSCPGYCLMTTHVHLVANPPVEEALAQVIGTTHLRYTQLLNAREGWKGHLWQNRFFSAPLDEIYRWRVLRYIELNPYRAGMVAAPEDYPWSSAAVHLGLRDAPPWLDMTEWANCWTPGTWRAYLNERTDAETDLTIIRGQTNLCRPIGSQSFIQHLEEQTGRCLHVGQVGRPRT